MTDHFWRANYFCIDRTRLSGLCLAASALSPSHLPHVVDRQLAFTRPKSWDLENLRNSHRRLKMLPTRQRPSPRTPSRHESLSSAANSIAYSANTSNGATCRYDSDAQLTVGTSHSPSGSHASALNKASLRRWGTNWLAARRKPNGPSEGIRGDIGVRLVYASPEPLVNLIFVHGLQGGSVKTWRKGDDPRYFWPQCWLPLEEGVCNVKTHSLGYDSG